MSYRSKIMVVLLVVACITASLFAQAAAEQPAAETTFIFTDSTGREVALPTDITRVAPSGIVAQMILYTAEPDALLGWGTKPTAAQNGYVPKQYLDLPVFGQFYGKNSNLNLEELIAADPQVIIDMGDMKATHKQDMDAIQERTGIPTIFIEANLKTFPTAYRTLGKLLGAEEQTEQIAQYIERTFALAQEKSAQVTQPKSVMFGTGKSGLNTNAQGSIHADVIEIVGAENAIVVPTVSNKGGGNTINMEQLLQYDPDVIILASEGPFETLGTDPLWQGLTAVQEGTYYLIPDAPYDWMANPPSVNRIIGIPWLGNLLYPEIYDIDMVAEAQEFYKLMWHYDLSTQQAQSILAGSTFKK